MGEDLIKPRTLKGFRDLLPEAMARREHLVTTAKDVYRSYGFSPIDTPALEYSDILLGKGGEETDKQLYRFEDRGGRDVALRFDLTVPLARFAAQHIGETGTPFKRYHVGLVWRGENTQRGRYREFVQCDFDTIGTTSVLADAETALVIHDLFAALGFERFTVRINNRKILSGMLEKLGLDERAVPVLRSVDKLAKAGRDAVAGELVEAAGTTSDQAEHILSLVTSRGTNRELLDNLASLVAGSEQGEQGVDELAVIVEAASAAGIPPDRLQIDASIARGLDYYTGSVYETFLDDLVDIGSCCSGGRYDDLASLYTKQRLPGVGASLGVDRLLAAMEELHVHAGVSSAADVLVVLFEGLEQEAVGLAGDLRRASLDVELYPDAKRLGTQLKYADRHGHKLAVIAGPEEIAGDIVQIKDLATGRTVEAPREDVAKRCRALLEA